MTGYQYLASANFFFCLFRMKWAPLQHLKPAEREILKQCTVSDKEGEGSIYIYIYIYIYVAYLTTLTVEW
jgi:hypothetical protein